MSSKTTQPATEISRRQFLAATAALGGWALLGGSLAWAAAPKQSLTIATGGTGGVYYPYGGGIAAVVSKNLPGVEVTAEVTAASVDNCKLVGAGKSDLGFCMADTAYDAFAGVGKFKNKLPLATVAVLYASYMHVVTVADKGIKGVADLKGKTVSTGAPGSGTEVKALRVLEAYGLNPDKDIKRDRLGAAESGGALKDNKIDAFFWDGGVPTASIMDLAATPGLTMLLLDHADCLPKLTEKYGPVYFPKTIAKEVYMGQKQDVAVAGVGNLLLCNQKAKPELIHDILKTMFEHHADLVAIHKEALSLTFKDAVLGSPVPFHPGAVKFFQEKGAKI
ncbi:MAG: TAXI family TRAP transporter solute-binding subunit [Desulfarculus sp.]|nr:TAXI family TRAP transporter solute-binding subunit [Desulfarculus sp.]